MPLASCLITIDITLIAFSPILIVSLSPIVSSGIGGQSWNKYHLSAHPHFYSHLQNEWNISLLNKHTYIASTRHPMDVRLLCSMDVNIAQE